MGTSDAAAGCVQHALVAWSMVRTLAQWSAAHRFRTAIAIRGAVNRQIHSLLDTDEKYAQWDSNQVWSVSNCNIADS